MFAKFQEREEKLSHEVLNLKMELSKVRSWLKEVWNTNLHDY